MAPTGSFIPVLLSSILIFFVIYSGRAVASQTPPECQREVLHQTESIETLFRLHCNLRTINSEYDQTNFSVIPWRGTVSLSIQCAQLVQHRSSLDNHGLQHLSQLQDLSISHCKLTSLPSNSLAGLVRLYNLSIHTHPDPEQQISLNIEAGALSGLQHLTSIDLSYSGLWRTPKEELCSLPSLTFLNVSHNNIKDVKDVGFHDEQNGCRFSSLVSLDLSYNDLKQVSPASFASANQLKVLILGNNQISQVHDGALSGLTSLKTLDLSGNRIVALPSTLFESVPELQQLRMDNNELSVLSGRLFHPLKRLVVMDLSSNLLQTDCDTCLSKRSFQGLSSLIVLNLSNNQISSTGPGLFRDMTNLQSLDMSNNLLTQIPQDSFHGLNNLYSLKLSGNKISSIELRSLNGLYTLNSLDLENNSISTIHQEAFVNSSNIKDLNLFTNSIYQIPDAIKMIHSLNTVDLGGNSIQRLEENTLASLPNLIGLKLDHNKISSIDKNAFARLENLQILNLGGNRISEIERGSFNQNRKLQAIRLDANQITNIVGIFSDLPSLKWLNISDNKIQKFDYHLMPRSLNWLDIHQNDIEEIGNYFGQESELNILTMDFSFNKLTSVNPSSIPDKVQTVSLNDNLITRIDPNTFSTKKHLIRVDLYANQIIKLESSSIRLPPRDLRHKKQRPMFYFGGNPFLCDCNLEWLQTINNEENFSLYPIVNDLESIYCRLMFSKENAVVPLVEAKSTDFLCKYTAHCFALCHCCDFDACDCEMTCPDNCTCYHDQSWSVNIVECASAGFWDPPTAIPMDATEVYLPGNNFEVLGSHSFIGRKNLKVLYLNNSNIESILNYTFFGLRQLSQLHLENNNIRRLEGHEFLSLRGLRELYLHRNLINFIQFETFGHLESLEILTLDNNRLFNYPGHFSLVNSPFLVEISLGHNPWSCECQHVTSFRTWVTDNEAKIVDSSKLACYINDTNTIGQYILEKSDCSSLTNTLTALTTMSDTRIIIDYLPTIIISVSVLIVISVALAVFIYYRSELQVWIFSKWGTRVGHTCPLSDAEHEKMYDAYVSYSIKDEHFVTQVLSSELEHCEPSYRVCLHYADLPQSTFVADSICEATHNSKRTIVVLSNNYIVHEWSRYDVRSALHDVLKSRGRAIILVLGDVPHRELDPDLRHYMKTNTTIHWSDRLFWDKLRFYLPTVPSTMCSSTGRTVPIHYNSNYCHPIYEVPRYPVVNGHGTLVGSGVHTPGHLTLSSQHGQHGHITHGHNIYEQGTMDSHLTAKIY